jgi:hypothetical protein
MICLPEKNANPENPDPVMEQAGSCLTSSSNQRHDRQKQADGHEAEAEVGGRQDSPDIPAEKTFCSAAHGSGTLHVWTCWLAMPNGLAVSRIPC